MRTLIVIPARLESTRLPRKLLLAETGRPLFWHAHEQASDAKESGQRDEWSWPMIATDSDEIIEAAKSLGCFTAKTSPHPNGTSRAAELCIRRIEGAELAAIADAICIVQGDVPDIGPDLIDEVIDALDKHPEWDCATAACPLYTHEHENANVVRAVVMHSDETAVDFSRTECNSNCWHHIGIYCYRREALLKYAAAGPCEREQAESLEQLRALHVGLKMGVVLTDEAPAGIDTREDYDAFVARYKAGLTPQPQSAQ